jgi:hypothetical protein
MTWRNTLVWAYGDKGGDITDFAPYRQGQFPGVSRSRQWVRISGPGYYLEFLNKYIARKKSRLAAASISVVDDKSKAKVLETYEKFFSAVKFLDRSGLKNLISSRYGLSMEHTHNNVVTRDQVDSIVDTIQKARDAGNWAGVLERARLLEVVGDDLDQVCKDGFSVLLNQYINFDFDEIQKALPGSTLVEFPLEGRAGFLALVLVKEAALWKVSMMVDGVN